MIAIFNKETGNLTSVVDLRDQSIIQLNLGSDEISIEITTEQSKELLNKENPKISDMI